MESTLRLRPAAVLAARATEVSQKVKKKKSKSGVLKQLKRALSSGGVWVSDEKDLSEEDSDEADDDLLEDDSSLVSWQNKRRRLRKVAEEHTENLLGGGELSPVVVRSQVLARWLCRHIRVSWPAVRTYVSLGRYSQALDDISQALDSWLRGKVDSAADLLIQRFKSLVMSLRDGDALGGHE